MAEVRVVECLSLTWLGSLVGTGLAEPLLLAAPHDQLFKKDYDPSCR
jgi:hypothetical protein